KLKFCHLLTLLSFQTCMRTFCSPFTFLVLCPHNRSEWGTPFFGYQHFSKYHLLFFAEETKSHLNMTTG
ncbi:MAG: hypothetical protein ACRC6F_11625, partial [Aeromonas sp.]